MNYFVSGLALLMGYSVYRQINPTLDDLKERKKKREQLSLNCIIGQASMEMDQKQINWEERCLKENQILDH